MLKIKNKKGELIAQQSDEDSQPQFIKDKKTRKKKKDKKEIEFTMRLAKEGEFEEKNAKELEDKEQKV